MADDFQAMIKSERSKMKLSIASSKRKANEREPLENIVLQKQVKFSQIFCCDFYPPRKWWGGHA